MKLSAWVMRFVEATGNVSCGFLQLTSFRLFAAFAILMVARLTVPAADLQWRHLSSSTGDLPVPGPSKQQTGAIVADLAKDGTNGFVLSFRQTAPALVWYRRTAQGWNRYVIESNYLTIEAGGVICDVDGDGHPNIIFGGDWQSNEVWWWENPYPNFDPKVSWKRHLIKKGGATQHHDQAVGDFLGTGKPQLAFWNQGDKSIYLAEIPPRPAPRGFMAADEDILRGSWGRARQRGALRGRHDRLRH